jgi:hypothetical protein
MPSARNGTMLRKCSVGNFVIPRQNNVRQPAKLQWNEIGLAQSAAAGEMQLFRSKRLSKLGGALDQVSNVSQTPSFQS